LESRSSRDNPKRDWYLWKDPSEDGGPPNNWLSVFGGIGWEWDEKTQQYYYHGFLKEQPDLNWRNAEVRKAMSEVMRFWLEKGVDGFRVDVIYHTIKDDQWRNNPINPDYQPHQATYEELLPIYSVDQPEVMEVVEMMRQVIDDYPERVMIGEIYLPLHRIIAYYGADNSGAHLPYNFQLITLPWNARQIQISNAIDLYEGSLPKDGWPNWVLGNHDQSRIATRVGSDQARIGAILLLTLRGTPTIYYGDEIGMKDTPVPPEEIQDPQGLNMPGLNLSRDPQRSPMQWTNQKYAGFSTVKPWLPVSDDYPRFNVDVEKKDPLSILSLYKRLIDLRRKEPALSIGCFIPLNAEEDILSYMREHEGKKFLIALNLGRKPRYFTPKNLHLKGLIVLGTHIEKQESEIADRIMLKGDEGVVIELRD
jgi:alpha-glucosidase